MEFLTIPSGNQYQNQIDKKSVVLVLTLICLGSNSLYLNATNPSEEMNSMDQRRSGCGPENGWWDKVTLLVWGPSA